MKKILSLKILLLVLFFGASLVWAEDRVVDVSVNVGDTILIVSGKAFPGAYITVTENEAVIGTVTADALGNFEKELFAQESGVRSIGLYGVDADNLTTSTSTHTLTLERGIDNILSNVILPPTISISGTGIAKGDTVDVFGYAPISSTVSVYVNDSLAGSTSSDAFGYYKYTYDTDTHTVGSSYKVYVKAALGSYTSQASGEKTFTTTTAPTATPAPTLAATATSVPTSILTPLLTVSVTPKPTSAHLPAPIKEHFDFDNDGEIGVKEVFKVVQVWAESWKEYIRELSEAGIEEQKWQETAKEKCDLNGDGICNLIDFSILMYYIGK